jgi:potassium-dependent mechanosensitive channel
VITINPNCRRCNLNASRTAGACVALILAFAVTTLMRPGPASAAAATVEAPAEQKIEVISVADISNRADADEEFIQAAVRRSETAERSSRFEQSLMSLSSGVKQLAGQSSGPVLLTLSPRTLASLQRHWQFYEREISRWRVELHRVTKASLEDSASMASRRALWRATRLAIADAAPALLQRVDETIDDIDRAAAVVSTSVTKSLDLERRGNALLAQVDSGKADVLASIADQDRQLLMIDSSALWQAAGSEETRKSIAAGMRESLEIDAAFGRDYDAVHINAMRASIVGGALLLPLMLWLRFRARRAIDSGQATAVSMHVLLRPWAAWLVLVALDEVFFGFRGPIIRQEAVIVLAWLPVLRLLPPGILKIISPWAYLTAACYFLNAGASLLVASELWYRALLLIIDMLALSSFVWLRLRLRRSALLVSTPNKRAVLDFLLVLAAAVLVASMGSNVLGNVSLSTMLTTAVLDSSYVALVLYAGAAVLLALFQLMLLRPTVSRLTRQNAGSFLQVAARLGRTSLVAAWLVSVLQFFRIYRPLLDWLIAVFSYHVQVGVLSISLGSSAGFVGAAWVAIWLAKTIRLVLSEDVLPKVSLPRGLGNTISTLTYYAILFLGLLAALAIAGFHIGELAIVFGALSVGIGFGLQDVVKNFVSGLILMFERPIQPGDVVDVAGVSGTVRDIGMRATILTTADGADVVVPNGMLLADKLTNWTLRSNSRRININVVTTYNANPQQTLELLVRIAAEVEGIAAAPPPVAILTGLATGALEFNLMAWTMDKTDWVGARSLLNVRIRDGLAEAGIEVPLPQRDLHLRSVSRAAAEELPGARVGTPSKLDEGGVASR